jgi:hypothetical protein
LDCAKGFYPEDEEDLKKSIDVARGIVDAAAAIDADVPQEKDLKQLNEKEKKKAIARKEKAFKKKERLEEKAPEKPLRQPRNQVVAQEKHPS